MSQDIDEMTAAIIAEHEGHLDRLVGLYREMKDRDATDGYTTSDPALGGMAMALQMLPRDMLLMIAALAMRRLGDVEDVAR